jgi:hypothetical protein
MAGTLVIRAGAGAASAAQLQACVDALLAEAPSRPDLSPDVAKAAQSAQASVIEDSSGLDPILTTILVTIVADLTTELIRGLWKTYLFPGIRRKLGSDAVDEDRLSIEEHNSEDDSKWNDGGDGAT